MEVFYHGSPKKFDSFEQKPWVAFDRKTVLSPLWFTKDKSFAKQNAGPNGWIYTVQVTPKKTFPTQDLIMWDGSYQMPTPYGEKLVEAMIARRMFGLDIDDWFEAEEVLKSIERLDYDVLETGDFIFWLKDNNYDSFLVRGDGPTNLAVLDGEDVEILSREPVNMSESNLENLLGELLNEEISPEVEEKIKTADPNDILTVYHGTPRFRIPDLINGFDSTTVHSRDYGGQKHRGLFVTPDFEVAKSFGGGAVFEIKIRAKYLHGTDYSGNIGRELKKRDEGLEDWVKGKFPNSFRPYMAMTMLQNVEPQALLIGVVKPSQITRVWVYDYGDKDWVEYTRDELVKSELSYNTRHVLGKYEHETLADAEIDLSDPHLKLEDYIDALAKHEKGDKERYLKMFQFYAKMGADKAKERLGQIEIGGSRLGRLALNNIVKQLVAQVDESIAPLPNLIDFLIEGPRSRNDSRPAWLIKRDNRHKAKMAKLRQQKKEEGLSLLGSLPKRTKITGWEEFVQHPYPKNSKRYQFWQTDKEGEVVTKRRKPVPKKPLPKYMYHGTNLVAAMKILGSQSKSNLNLSANPGYSLTYAADALENDEIPVAVIRIATKDLDTRYASFSDDFAAENIVYKKPIPGSKFKLFQVGVPEELLESTTSHAPLESLLEYLLVEGRTQTDEKLEKVLEDWVAHGKRAPTGPHWFPPHELFRYREFHRSSRPDLQKSMRQKGFDPKYPIQLAFGKNGKILIVEGNHRLKTAIQLKIDKVPVEFNFMNKVEKWQEMEDKANMTLDKEKIRKQQAEKRKKAEDRKLGIDSMEKLLQQQREKRKAELKAMTPEEREEHEKKKEKNVEDIMKLIGF